MASFFEHQDDARRRSARLIAAFVLGVLFVVVVVWLSVEIFWHNFTADMGPLGQTREFTLHGHLFLWTLVSVGGTIGLASWFHIRTLASGGSSVALQLGGRNIDPATPDPDERRLVNVVEEMSIASGVPVPQIFVLDRESSINAFAAGYSPDDAAVAVTRGTLHLLTRDELQGVIAHEFSHILNADIRLNIRAAGILHGLSVLSEIGLSVAFAGRENRRSGQRGNIAGAFALLGFAVFAAGYIGLVTGRVIRAAISREREHLADASAAQFTRNPAGLASALAKIGAMQKGHHWITHPFAEEYSHLFFAPVRHLALLSTHPPIEQRIRKLDPHWDGRWPDLERARALVAEVDAAKRPPVVQSRRSALDPVAGAPLLGASLGAAVRAAGGAGSGGGAEPRERGAVSERPAAASGHVLPPSPVADGDPLADATRFLASLPSQLTAAAHTPDGAIAIALHLIVRDRSPDPALFEGAPPGVQDAFVALGPDVAALPEGRRLPVLRLCAPAFRQLGPHHGARVLGLLVAALRDTWTLIDLALYRCVMAWVTPVSPREQVLAIRPLVPAIGTLLSAVAHAGSDTAARTAYAHGAGLFRELRVDQRPTSSTTRAEDVTGFVAADELDAPTLDSAFEHLTVAAPVLRARVVEAARRVIVADGLVTASEAELYAALLEVLGDPISVGTALRALQQPARQPSGAPEPV